LNSKLFKYSWKLKIQFLIDREQEENDLGLNCSCKLESQMGKMFMLIVAVLLNRNTMAFPHCIPYNSSLHPNAVIG
jgi:hypothetical protein